MKGALLRKIKRSIRSLETRESCHVADEWSDETSCETIAGEICGEKIEYIKEEEEEEEGC